MQVVLACYLHHFAPPCTPTCSAQVEFYWTVAVKVWICDASYGVRCCTMSQKVEGFQLFLGFVILPASCFIAFVVLPPPPPEIPPPWGGETVTSLYC